MEAYTPMFDISIENTTGDTTEDEDIHEYLYEGFNFGIIKQPEPSVEVEKKITNVKLTNTPLTIFDGNPETGDLTGVSDLDGSTNGGSTYTRVELQEDYIYGSTLTVTYELTITNTSDLNYYEYEDAYYGWYYMFGEHDESYSSKVEITIDSVLDGYDPDLTWVVADSSSTSQTYTITSSVTESGGTSNAETETYLTKLEGEYDSSTNTNTWEDENGNSGNDTDNDGTNEYEYTPDGTVLTMMENMANDRGSDAKDYDYDEIIYSSSWGSTQISESVSISVSFTKTLSTQDEDMAYVNVGAVNELSVTKISTASGKNGSLLVKRPKLPTPSPPYITISPPTGNDKQAIAIYVVAGVIGLIILSAGIIIIKKKIL